MNRKIIILTIVSMTIALIGLMGIQIYWITNASSVKEANFKRTVNEAITRVVSKIEQIEKRKAMQINQFEGMMSMTGANADERKRLAHTIKGTARSVGAFQVADVAERIERAPLNSSLVNELGTEIAHALDFINAINR